jgi:hypothetical protein
MKTVKITRRNALLAGGGAAAILAAGLGGRFLLRKRHAPSPYDDLLSLLDDRDADAQIGETVLAEVEEFEPKAMADELRTRLGGRPLAAVLVEDTVQNRVVEAGGWVLPETLGLLCALAAKAAA